MRSKIFHRFIAVTLLFALLLISGSRAVCVSALADPIPEAVAPVFDTQIYQLKDYIDNGGMSDPQLEIFYILSGLYAVSQSGSQEYQLKDPFENQSGVWNWLKSMGIKTYNSVVNLIPDTARMPITGEIYSTIPFKNAASAYIDILMGITQEAKKYSTVEEFQDTVAQGSYYLPWNFDIQKGMNSIFGIYGGIYEWQFDSQPFSSNISYVTSSNNPSNLQLAEYNNWLNALVSPKVRGNRDINHNFSNLYMSSDVFITYHNLFINTDTHYVYLTNDSGESIHDYPTNVIPYIFVAYNTNNALNITNVGHGSRYINKDAFYKSYNPANYNTLVQLVNAIYNGALFTGFDMVGYTYLEDFVNHVYAGTNWLNKHEIFNLTDLNFDEPDLSNDIDIYHSVPENQQYYLDIYNILQDLLGNSDLFQIIINNIVDKNGVKVHDDQLIKITTSIYKLLEETNPVLPVNLNDIAEYTDNTYLDIVKERAKRGGNELANLVAFWHNCDPELIYVLFGAGITILVGAFIGKWGHS